MIWDFGLYFLCQPTALPEYILREVPSDNILDETLIVIVTFIVQIYDLGRLYPRAALGPGV